MPNFGALGISSEPQLERKRICREPFTLDKWNNMTAYKVDQPEQPQPAARRASPRHIPEGITVAAPAIPRAPPAAQLHLSHPHQLSRGWPFLYLNIESCAVHWRLLQLLRAVLLRDGSHQSMPRADVATQAQQAAILRQLQVHFDLPQAVEPSTSTQQSHTLIPESHPPEPKPQLMHLLKRQTSA
ncbi:hypothetical protein CK203_097535 [Vitis vinifera]|uniref:Uncharacterized protein n=1 Tax=Vitis vinifera TaxID=29760 RepID=A0A438CWK0_VITVI|nr:hypothetical protein CK203_097535 [Vitis vinifera]